MGRADTRIGAEGNQPRHVDDRLYGPVARAAEAAYEEHADVRREDAAGEGWPVRRRLLRLAVALLRDPGDQASGLAEPLRRVQGDDGRRRLLPRELRRRARR